MAAGTVVGTVSVRVRPDTTNFGTSLQKYLDRIEKSNVLNIRADLDGSGLSAQAARAVSAAQKAAGDLNVDSDLDTSGLVGEARRAKAAAEEAAGPVEYESDVDSSSLIGQVRRAAAVASQAAKVHLKVDVDTSTLDKFRLSQSGIGGVAGSMAASLGGATASMARLSAIAGTAVVAVSGLAPVLAAVGTAAAGALAPVAGLTAGLGVAGIGAGALAIGTLKMALSGMGDALKAADPAAFSAAIADMGPAAQGAATALFELKDSFSGIGEGVQEAFFAPLQNLGQLQVLVAPIGDAMTGIATSFGTAAAGLVDFVTQGQGLAAMNSIIDYGGQAVSAWAGTVGELGKAFVAIGGAAAPVLAQLSEHIAGVASAWTDRVVAAFQSGDLTAYFQGAVDKAAQLWGVFQQLGGIIGGVFTAMSNAGMPMLGMLGMMVSATEQWVNSAQGMSTLTGFFTQMSGAMQAMLPVVGQLVTFIVGTLGPALADLLTAALPGISAGLQPIMDAIAQLMPLMAPLGAVIGQLAAMIGPVLGAAISALVPVIQVIIGVLNFLMPVIQLIMTGLQQLMPIIVGILAVVAVAIGVLFMVANPITTIVVVIGLLIAALAGAWPMISSWAQNVAHAFMDMCRNAIQWVSNMASQVVSWFSQMWSNAVAMVTSMVMSVINFFSNMASQAINLAGQLVSGAVGFFSGLPGQLGGLASAAWHAVTSFFSSGVSEAVSIAGSMPGRVVGVLGNLGGLLVGSGRALIQGFVNGIQSMIGAVESAAHSVASAARRFFPFSPAKEGPFSGHGWVLYSGRSIGRAFAQGMDDSNAMVAASAGMMASAAQSNLSSVKASIPSVDGGGGPRGQVSGAGVDASVTIGTVVAADPKAPLREAEDMAFKARVRSGAW